MMLFIVVVILIFVVILCFITYIFLSRFVLVEVEAVFVDVVEDGDEHAQAGHHQQGERPDGQEAEMPVEQTTGSYDSQAEGHEQAAATVTGIEGVVAEAAQQGKAHGDAEDAAHEEGGLVDLLFHTVL